MALCWPRNIVLKAVRLTFAEWDNGAWFGPPFSEEYDWLKPLQLVVENGKYRGWNVETKTGTVLAVPGDYIIKNVEGQLLVCPSDVFETLYTINP